MARVIRLSRIRRDRRRWGGLSAAPFVCHGVKPGTSSSPRGRLPRTLRRACRPNLNKFKARGAIQPQIAQHLSDLLATLKRILIEMIRYGMSRQRIAARVETNSILARLAALSADHFESSSDKIRWRHVVALNHYRVRLCAVSDAALPPRRCKCPIAIATLGRLATYGWTNGDSFEHVTDTARLGGWSTDGLSAMADTGDRGAGRRKGVPRDRS